jgi:tol-pal system beta propeller repeat protein TolB
MEPRTKLLSKFDRFLLAGLGCGVLVLCALGGWIYYIMNTLPVPGSPATPLVVLDFPTLTPIAAIPDSVLATSSPTASPTLDGAFIPSPIPSSFDGTPPVGKIAFTCYIKQIDQICIMNADGTERKQLTNFDATAFYPSISPDGQTVFFSSKQSGGFEIYSMDINGDGKQRLTKNIGSLYAPELSPDGDRILFTNNGNGLWVMKPDGDNPHRISDRDDIDPTWSPDGSMIAFASSRVGDRQLFVMNADGSNVQQVTNLDNMGGRSTWSPDGTKLAFYRGPAGDHNIYVINVDGTGLVQLTNGGDNLGPSWSPDGNWIAFTSFRDGNNEIYVIHPDGTGVTRVTNNPISDWQPRWGR